MCAVVVGSILLYAVFGSASSMYIMSSGNENQILASNMAQQVIDNARDSSFGTLNLECNGSVQSTSTGTSSQVLSLYQYPSGSNPFFPRPLLRNTASTAGMSYSTASTNKPFPGTVTETLTTINAYVPQPPDVAISTGPATGEIQVTVLCQWKDSQGSHKYTTSTLISQTGIHN